MADLLMHGHEHNQLTGATVPRVGQHNMTADGDTALAGGLSALAKDQRYKLVHGTHTPWSLAFEAEVEGVGGGASADSILQQRFGVAIDVLRNHSESTSFRQYSRSGKSFAAVQGDVEDAGVAAAALAAMEEACRTGTLGVASASFVC